MKILYLGCYRDGTGWGKAATDYVLALDAAGADVACRPIRLNDHSGPVPDRIAELEGKSARGCDLVVQHTLPHLYDYNGRLLNVGMYATETSDFRTSSWADKINTMDAAVVFNRQSAEASRLSGVTVPLSVVPHATDISRFQKSYSPLDAMSPFKEAGDFLFYTVGEFTRRKNLAALVKAFHLEFDPGEPVQLVIKTSKPGWGVDQCAEEVGKFCDGIKNGLKLHGGRVDFCKKEILITTRLTEHGMMRLHSACDVFVQPSYGEAWSIPAFDAMAMGKTPVVTAATGYLDYVGHAEGWLVDCRPEPVFGENDTFQDLFVGAENWGSVDVGHLRRCMREAYEDNQKREEKSANGIARAYDFDYGVVGPRLKGVLENVGRKPLEIAA